MIHFACSRCATKFKVRDDCAGRKTRCPTCQKSLLVPAPDRTDALALSEGFGGSVSSMAQSGITGNVTLAAPSSKDTLTQKSLPELLDRSSNADERYHLEGEIARGGMGAVVRAVDRDIRREVAIKYLLDQSDARKKHRFVEEAQITGQLEHPNIVPIHELGVDAQKRLFFAMKMVKGRSLAQILDDLRKNPDPAEKAYPLGRLLGMFTNVCHALAYAHSRNVIHRDLKPANIMVGDFGEVYVMDWGLAKILKDGSPDATEGDMAEFEFGDEPVVEIKSPTKVNTSRDADTDLTREGAVLGTPVYMPPEQAMGKAENVDQLSDVYSLGAILYEMIVLEAPINRDGGHLAVLVRVAKGQIMAPADANPERARAGKIPRELVAIAMKAMARRPGQRYKSVEALREDVERFQEGKSVSAKADRFHEMAWKLVKRNKGVSVTAVIALCVLAGVLAFSFQAILASKKNAENALAALEQEQKDKRAKGKTSASLFVRDAKQSGDKRLTDYALAQVNVALEFDPDNVEGRLVKAQLLIVQKNFDAARDELQTYLRVQPRDKEAAELLRLCKEANAGDAATAHAFADIFIRQKLYGFAEQMELDRDMLVRAYRKRIDAAWPDYSKRLFVKDGKFRLDLTGASQIQDLSPLEGIPLDSLVLSMCLQIRDLSPLQGMPLTELTLTKCAVRDLSPLKGLPLAKLNLVLCDQLQDLSGLQGLKLSEFQLNGCRQVTDLSPLKGMPLSVLLLSQSDQIKDLEPLQGMPLTKLTMAGVLQPRDLSALIGMPLTFLDLSNSPGIKDLTPLHGMPLTELVLTDCVNVQDLAPLEGMKLVKLNLPSSPKCKDLSPLKGMPLSTLTMVGCRQVQDITPLAGMNLTTLTVKDSPLIRDLAPLKGQKIATLIIADCAGIRDIAPLQGMPLLSLDLSGCQQLDDIAPLKGMDLKMLDLHGCTQVKDLSPLHGMNLTVLDLRGCQQITDLTPLDGVKLFDVAFSPKYVSKGINVLRQMKGIRTISGDIGPVRQMLPPGAFWKKYDAGEFGK